MKSGVILLLIFCTQFFPYIHFHHSHDDNNFNIIVSSHPVKHENNHHSEQHNGEHHHEGNEHIVADWNYIKTVSNSPLKISVNLEYITNLIFDEKVIQISIVYKEPTHPPPNKNFISPDLSRGPPALQS